MPLSSQVSSARVTCRFVLAIAVFFGAGGAAQAQLAVSEIQLSVSDQRTAGITDVWNFEVLVVGSGITSASVKAPGGATEPLSDAGVEWEFEEEFSSLALLQARWGNGTYVVTVNGQMINLTFDLSQSLPASPNGDPAVTWPAHGTAIPNRKPTFTSKNACTNCNVFEALIESDFDDTINIESFFQSPTVFPGAHPFAGFPANTGTAGPVTQLPTGTNLLFCVITSIHDVIPLTTIVDTDNAFDYRRISAIDDAIGFSVTNPGAITSDVDEIFVEYAERGAAGISSGWYFEVGVDGTNLAAGEVIPPDQDPIPLMLVGASLEFDDGPEVDENTVRGLYPPTDGTSKYVVVLDGGEKFVSLDFNPVSADGGVVITAPSDGSTTNSQPTTTVSNACTNCDAIELELDDVATEGMDIEIEFFESGMSLPTSILFSELEANSGAAGPISELPAGMYDLAVTVFPDSFTLLDMEPSDSFGYIGGVLREDTVVFTVPEPAAWLQAGIACLAIAGLRRRRAGGAA